MPNSVDICKNKPFFPPTVLHCQIYLYPCGRFFLETYFINVLALHIRMFQKVVNEQFVFTCLHERNTPGKPALVFSKLVQSQEEVYNQRTDKVTVMSYALSQQFSTTVPWYTNMPPMSQECHRTFRSITQLGELEPLLEGQFGDWSPYYHNGGPSCQCLKQCALTILALCQDEKVENCCFKCQQWEQHQNVVSTMYNCNVAG